MKSKYLNLNWKEISQFLDFITEGQNGYFEIRVIKGKVVDRKFFKNADEMVEWIRKKERFLVDKDVYVSLNARREMKGSAEAIESANNFFIDIDSEDAKNNYKKIYLKLQELGLTPSLICDSGHGLHIYYKTDELIGSDEWLEIEEGLLLFFIQNFKEYKIDIQSKDIARCPRLIGTINNKEMPVPTKILAPDFTTYRAKYLKNKLPKQIDIFQIEAAIRAKKLEWIIENRGEIIEKFRNPESIMDLVRLKLISRYIYDFYPELGLKLSAELKKVLRKKKIDFNKLLKEFKEEFGHRKIIHLYRLAKQKGVPDILKLDIFAETYAKLKRKVRKKKINWIERVISTPISDGRKIAIWKIIGPYLITVKKMGVEEAYEAILNWVEECMKLRYSRISNSWIRSVLRGIERKGILPISKEKFVEEYSNLEDVKEIIALIT